ncbi:hypothetical protein Tco_1216241 [Tanacetum coccineum]
MGDTITQTRFENVSKHSNDSLLARGNTLRSDEDRLKLEELMALCTTLQNRVLDLEKTKTTQANEIASLKRRVKKLENKNRSRTHKLKRLYKVGLTARVESSGDEESLGEDASKQGRINAIDEDEEITLGKMKCSLEALKTLKPKVKGIVFQELGKSTTTIIISSQQSQDKGKGILIEPVEPLKKKDLIRLDEEVALKLQIDVDHQLAKRLQAQEQEELSIKEKATLFQQLLEKRRKYFAAKRAEEKRNKPPTKAQQRKIIAFKRVNTFEYFRTELVEGKEKREGTELAQEIAKNQKVKDDKETTENKKLIEIIPDKEEVAIDAIPLAVKSLSIVDWKIYNEGRKAIIK